jgi:uncharacterized protein (DUF2225 family)
MRAEASVYIYDVYSCAHNQFHKHARDLREIEKKGENQDIERNVVDEGKRLNVIELDKDENGGRKKEDAMSMYIFLTNRKRNQSNST